MVEILLGFAMVLTRISGFFMLLPVFGWTTVPIRIKVAMTILIAIFFSTITPLAIDPQDVSLPEAILC